MASVCCLAGIEEAKIAKLSAALHRAGVALTVIVAPLRVTELGHLAPELIVCDIDDHIVDHLETLRQIRFVLPQCIIAVFTRVIEQSWVLSCHLAGANCVLSKDSSIAELAQGLLAGMESGCFTDPRFDAA
jgi:DNA-binding NarL/FixJ family response regulator